MEGSQLSTQLSNHCSIEKRLARKAQSVSQAACKIKVQWQAETLWQTREKLWPTVVLVSHSQKMPTDTKG
jgi:hypothetical protein